MNDEDLPMRAELASAYLDGELDAAERQAVEADPQAMAIVESFSAVRSSLTGIDAPDERSKASALAAALAEFDQLHASSVVAAPPAAIALLRHRRMRTYRFVMGTAAAAVIAVVALAAINSGSDSSSSSATEALAAGAGAQLPTPKVADSSAAENASIAAAAGTAAPADAAAQAGVAPTGTALAIPAIDDAQALAAYVADRNRTFASVAPSTTAAASAATVAAPPESSAAPSPASVAPDFTTFAVPSCLQPSQVVLGPITVSGAPAFAVSDTSTNSVEAIDATDCHVFFSTPAP